MNNIGGWFLVWKKIWKNPLLQGNPYALAVWIWLISYADEDGIVTCGRNQIAKETGVKAPTVQYWLKRFLSQNYQLTIIKTNNKFSTFRICNYQKYQRKTINPSFAKLSENYQPPITNKELKNKELKNNNIITNVITTSINEILEFSKSLNFPLQGSAKQNRYAISNLLRHKNLDVNQIKRLIEGVAQSRGQPYSPTINDFPTLYRKYADLVTFIRKQQGKETKHVKIV